MEFEFDPAKSASNLEKHGIDFDAIQAIWQDVMRVEIPARTADEPRWLVIGQIDDKHWSVVVTYRGPAGQDHLRPPVPEGGGGAV